MKHSLYFFLLICLGANSQNSIFIKTGKNLTNYSYYNQLGSKATNLSSEFGHSFSIGFSKPLSSKLIKSPIVYDTEISFDEFNSSVYNKNLIVNWKTLYVGLNNSLLLQVFNTKKIKLNLKLGATISNMIYGKQEIEGDIFDLKHTNSFRGIFMGGDLGIQAKYFTSDYGGFSLGYDYVYSFNPTLNGSEKFSISSNRLCLGIIFNIKNNVQ